VDRPKGKNTVKKYIKNLTVYCSNNCSEIELFLKGCKSNSDLFCCTIGNTYYVCDFRKSNHKRHLKEK